MAHAGEEALSDNIHLALETIILMNSPIFFLISSAWGLTISKYKRSISELVTNLKEQVPENFPSVTSNFLCPFLGQKVNPGKPITDQPAPTSESYLGNVPPPNYFMSPPLTSLQLRQEREDAIKENDRYWKKRVNQLELNHGEVRQVMDKEYQRAVSTH